MAKIKMPTEYNGNPTHPIEDFHIGPIGPERDKAREKLFSEDPQLEHDYKNQASKRLREKAQKTISEKLDEVYNIHPGEVVECPEDHAQKLLDTFGFLKRVPDSSETTEEDLEEAKEGEEVEVDELPE